MTQTNKIAIGVATALVVVGGGAVGLATMTHLNAEKFQEQIKSNLNQLKSRLPSEAVFEEISSSATFFDNKGQLKLVVPDKAKPEMSQGVLVSYHLHQNLFTPITGHYNLDIGIDPIGPIVETTQFKNKGVGPWITLHQDSGKPELDAKQNPIQFTSHDNKLGDINVEMGAGTGTLKIGADYNTEIIYSLTNAKATISGHTFEANKISGNYQFNPFQVLNHESQNFSKEMTIEEITSKDPAFLVQNFKAKSSGILNNQEYTLTNDFQIANLNAGQAKGLSGELSFTATLSHVNELRQIAANLEATTPKTKEAAKKNMLTIYQNALKSGVSVSINKLNVNSPMGNLSIQAQYKTTAAANNQPFTLYQNSTIDLSGTVKGEVATPTAAFIGPFLGLQPTTPNKEFQTALKYENGTVKVNGTDTNPALTALVADKLKLADIALGFTEPPAVVTPEPAADYSKLPFPDNLREKVRSNIVLPDNIVGNPGVVLRIKQSKDGTVEGVSVTKSSGNKQLDDAVVLGIQKSSPLPRDGNKDADTLIDITYYPLPLTTKK